MKFGNDRKSKFLDSVPTTSLDSSTDDLTSRCKFNFSYFDVQEAGQAFEDWNHNQLCKLLDKIKGYCGHSLNYWRNQSSGKHGKVLQVYGNFPTKSDFTHPKHVPHQAQWSRFRLESAVRLVGFTIPGEYHGQAHSTTGERFDANTFYVVFLDADHKFYKTEQK